MENIASQLMAEGFESIGAVAKGLKNITVEMETYCPRCDGEGKRPKPIHRMPINKNWDVDPIADMPDAEMIDCSRCNGSGLLNTTIKVDVTKSPAKKEEKKK